MLFMLIIPAMLLFFLSWFMIKNLGIQEMIDYYGPLLWGFWGEIWESETLTKFGKIIFIFIGFLLYSIMMILSLLWLKPIFVKGK